MSAALDQINTEDGRLRLEHWPLDRLLPSPRNARTHSGAQVAEIAGSIRAFGFTNPILVGEDGDVIAGHGRLAAAHVLGLAEVPVIPLGGLSQVQRGQLMLADNRIALNAGWDIEMLNLELKELSVLGADLGARVHRQGVGRRAQSVQRTRYRPSPRPPSRLWGTSGALDRTASSVATAPMPTWSRLYLAMSPRA
jgi:ParB-like nuclease domain